MTKINTDKDAARKFGLGTMVGAVLGAGAMAAKRRRDRKKSNFHRIMDQLNDRF